jgi:hypothetical protein
VIDRWRGRRGSFAIAAWLLAGLVVAAAAAGSGGPAGRGATPVADAATAWHLVIRRADGETLLRVPLPDGRFALRYRNSVYGSMAEERFAISPDGRLALIGLAADEAAVLDEYYQVAGPPRRSASGARHWEAPPAAALSLAELALAATEHGRRTLVIDGMRPIPLWRLAAADDPGLTLTAERST